MMIVLRCECQHFITVFISNDSVDIISLGDNLLLIIVEL